MNELGPKPPPRHRQLAALLSAQAPPVGPRLAGEPERPSIAWLSRRDRLVHVQTYRMSHEVTISVGDERGHFLIPGIVN